MKLNSITKLSLLTFLVVASFASPSFVRLALCLAVGVLGAASPLFRPFSPSAERILRRFLVYIFVFALVIVFANGLLLTGGRTVMSVGPWSMHEEGLAFGFRAASRIALLSVALVVFFTSTPLREFALLLERLRLPRVMVSLTLLTVYFIERMPAHMTQIYVAQESRGAPVRAGLFSRIRAFVSILSPLVISSLIESLERGVALELRGFHLSPARTIPTVPLTPVESLATLTFLSGSALLILWWLVQWVFLS